jgi:chromosome segregation ATPase
MDKLPETGTSTSWPGPKNDLEQGAHKRQKIDELETKVANAEGQLSAADAELQQVKTNLATLETKVGAETLLSEISQKPNWTVRSNSSSLNPLCGEMPDSLR